MKNCFSLLAVLTAFLISCHPAFGGEGRALLAAAPEKALHQHSAAPAHGCPPVAHILVDFLPGGGGLIMWDPVAGADKYLVELTDSGNNMLLDTVTSDTHMMVSGLTPGKNYTVTVCYRCPESDELICSHRTFRYIIIEDQVVMVDGGHSCTCKNVDAVEGTCSNSETALYDLSTPRVYNITLLDGNQMSFVCKFQVNPVGDCPSDFVAMGMGIHGAGGEEMPFYQVGNSKIFFHGTTFCIQGSSAISVTYCDVKLTSKEKNDAEQTQAFDVVFPNPFQEKITVEVPETGAGARFELFNTVGQKMLESIAEHPGLLQMNTSALTPGWYYLRCSGGAPTNSGKWLFKSW